MFSTPPNTTSNPGGHYAFYVKGYLPPERSEWFDGLKITQLENGNTVLSGNVADQAALHGILAKIRDLNLTLISIHQL